MPHSISRHPFSCSRQFLPSFFVLLLAPFSRKGRRPFTRSLPARHVQHAPAWAAPVDPLEALPFDGAFDSVVVGDDKARRQSAFRAPPRRARSCSRRRVPRRPRAPWRRRRHKRGKRERESRSMSRTKEREGEALCHALAEHRSRKKNRRVVALGEGSGIDVRGRLRSRVSDRSQLRAERAGPCLIAESAKRRSTPRASGHRGSAETFALEFSK